MEVKKTELQDSDRSLNGDIKEPSSMKKWSLNWESKLKLQWRCESFRRMGGDERRSFNGGQKRSYGAAIEIKLGRI